MNERKQQDAFSNELARLVNRFANEFEMTYTSTIGCLELQKAKLLNELLNPELYDTDDENE